jgi:hypothetical protein
MIWKHPYPGLAALVVGIGLIGPLQATAQNPPWQEPPTSGPFNAWTSQSCSAGEPACSETPGCKRGAACGPAGPCGDCDDGCSTGGSIFGPCCGLTMPHDDWVRVDALLWWTKGAAVPPLLTTASPDSTPQTQAGVLGERTTSILLGNQELNKDLRAGYRISFGTWLNQSDNLGIEFNYLGLSQNTDRIDRASTGSPILARPFFDVDTGVENAHLIAYPGVLQGTFSCASTSNFQVAEFLTRWALARAPGRRIELLGGFRFQQLTDSLDITDTSGPGAPSQSIQIFDQFRTRNDFYGGELGVASEWRQCRWSVESSLKVALGSTYSRIDINGSTTTAAGSLPGGLLALPSNMGVHNSNQFAAIPELALTLGYDLTCHLRAVAGYTFMYWSPISRPGDQIDLNVSPSQFPGPGQTPALKPQFVQHTADFWAQGVNVGLDYRF